MKGDPEPFRCRDEPSSKEDVSTGGMLGTGPRHPFLTAETTWPTTCLEVPP